MVVVIAGSRDIIATSEQISSGLEVLGFNQERDEVISGGAQGVDMCAAEYCMDRGITFTEYAADWEKYGRSAGPRRNALMAEDADALLLIWDGVSRGSQNMRAQMIAMGKKVHEIIVKS